MFDSFLGFPTTALGRPDRPCGNQSEEVFSGPIWYPHFEYTFFTIGRLVAKALLYDRRTNLLWVVGSDQLP